MKRRFKIVRIARTCLIDLVNFHLNPPGFLALPVTDDLPEDSQVIDIREDLGTRTVEFLVYSESFDEVPEGQMIPIIPDVVTHFVVKDFQTAARSWRGGRYENNCVSCGHSFFGERLSFMCRMCADPAKPKADPDAPGILLGPDILQGNT